MLKPIRWIVPFLPAWAPPTCLLASFPRSSAEGALGHSFGLSSSIAGRAEANVASEVGGVVTPDGIPCCSSLLGSAIITNLQSPQGHGMRHRSGMPAPVIRISTERMRGAADPSGRFPSSRHRWRGIAKRTVAGKAAGHRRGCASSVRFTCWLLAGEMFAIRTRGAEIGMCITKGNVASLTR